MTCTVSIRCAASSEWIRFGGRLVACWRFVSVLNRFLSTVGRCFVGPHQNVICPSTTAKLCHCFAGNWVPGTAHSAGFIPCAIALPTCFTHSRNLNARFVGPACNASHATSANRCACFHSCLCCGLDSFLPAR